MASPGIVGLDGGTERGLQHGRALGRPTRGAWWIGVSRLESVELYRHDCESRCVICGFDETLIEGLVSTLWEHNLSRSS